MRKRAVEAAALRAGAMVLDIGCGTGLTFAHLEERIGPSGHVIGIDVSPEMLAKARQRAQEGGWRNVTLIESTAEEAKIPARVDAALFVLTHDVMRSPAALRHIVEHVKPGGRVVAGGARQPRWARRFGPLIRFGMGRYTTTTEGIERPWSYLADVVPHLEIESLALGAAYVAWGRTPLRTGATTTS
jgi:ubiquinone/menaquinone biosynthesis C-methylase UbiE